jgi:hypothetical protein
VTVKADVGGLETLPGLRSGSYQPFIQTVQSEQNGYMESYLGILCCAPCLDSGLAKFRHVRLTNTAKTGESGLRGRGKVRSDSQASNRRKLCYLDRQRRDLRLPVSSIRSTGGGSLAAFRVFRTQAKAV